MPKLTSGFLLGVVTTLAVMYWLNWPPETQPSHADKSALAALVTKSSHGDPVNSVDLETQEGVEKPNVSTAANSVGVPLQAEAEPRIASPTDNAATDDAQSSTRTYARMPNDEYPPEISEMIENRVDKDLQERYENDAREDSWAPYMESLLATYFAQKPVLSQFYFSLIDCRTSVCEIHALGYGVDALTQWNTATADMVSQPWFEFTNMSMNRRNAQPDILAIVLILTKEPPD